MAKEKPLSNIWLMMIVKISKSSLMFLMIKLNSMFNTKKILTSSINLCQIMILINYFISLSMKFYKKMRIKNLQSCKKKLSQTGLKSYYTFLQIFITQNKFFVLFLSPNIHFKLMITLKNRQ